LSLEGMYGDVNVSANYNLHPAGYKFTCSWWWSW